MKFVRPGAVALTGMLLLATTMMSYAPASAQGGNNAGGPGCVQTASGTGAGGNAGAAGTLLGGNRSDSNGTVVSVIGLLVQNANVLDDVGPVVAAINALNSNNINAQVVCLNNVLNGNDIRLIEDVLNNNDVLNNSPILNSNNVPILNNSLNNALQNADISLLNNVQVVAVNLGGTPQIFLLRR
jgi:hypothetical protein